MISTNMNLLADSIRNCHIDSMLIHYVDFDIMTVVGKNILDNLTTGMYSDSKVIYREYIQNACDQIDIALKTGLLKEDEGTVDIFLDYNNRYISVKDNATGVKSSLFIENLGDIANSNKQIGENKGFRGIGRLCGLAYCKTLKFTTSYKGENKKSIMTCNAQKMRQMLLDSKRYTLDDIWNTIVSFSTENEAADAHYFEVEMFDINKENTDLLDKTKVTDYLSFVAPVPYRNTFSFRKKIYDYAESINYKIDEYKILINGEQIFKKYTDRLKDSVTNGNNTKPKIYDEITDLEFKNIYDSNNNLLAWLWIGISCFEKQIPKINKMRGLRLRSSNIQLGNDNALQHLFKESRGNYYFIGEVFAVDKALIPNSQRDYFNENEKRIKFENSLRIYFYDELHKLYYDANRIKNALKHQDNYLSKCNEFKQKSLEGSFINEEEKNKLQYEIEKAKKDADEATRQLNKFKETKNLLPISRVMKNLENKYKNTNENKEILVQQQLPNEIVYKKDNFITSKMSSLSRNERKLVSKILTIITDNAPSDVAEKIINKMKEQIK